MARMILPTGETTEFDPNRVSIYEKIYTDGASDYTHSKFTFMYSAKRKESRHLVGKKALTYLWWDKNTDKYYRNAKMTKEVLSSTNYFVRWVRKDASTEGIKIGYLNNICPPQKMKYQPLQIQYYRFMAKIEDPANPDVWINGKYIQYTVYSKYYKAFFKTEKYQVDDGDVSWNRGEKERLWVDLYELGVGICGIKYLFPKEGKKVTNLIREQKVRGFLIKKQRMMIIKQEVLTSDEVREIDEYEDLLS